MKNLTLKDHIYIRSLVARVYVGASQQPDLIKLVDKLDHLIEGETRERAIRKTENHVQ